MSHSGYSDEFTDDEDEEEEEDDAGGGGAGDSGSEASAASSLGKLVVGALRRGEYKSAKTADGREYWYHVRTQETTWDLRRTLAGKRASAAASTASAAKAAADNAADKKAAAPAEEIKPAAAAAATPAASPVPMKAPPSSAASAATPPTSKPTPAASAAATPTGSAAGSAKAAGGSPEVGLGPPTSSLYRRRTERERSGSLGGLSVHTSQDGERTPALSPIPDSPRRADSVNMSSRAATPSIPVPARQPSPASEPAASKPEPAPQTLPSEAPQTLPTGPPPAAAVAAAAAAPAVPESSDFSDVSTYLDRSRGPAAAAAAAPPSATPAAAAVSGIHTSSVAPPGLSTIHAATPGGMTAGMAGVPPMTMGGIGQSALSIGASPGMTTIARADTTGATAMGAGFTGLTHVQHAQSGTGAAAGAPPRGAVDTPIPFANMSAETLAGVEARSGLDEAGCPAGTLGGPSAYSLPPHGPPGAHAAHAHQPATADMLCRLMAAYHDVLSNEEETTRFRKARREQKGTDSVVQRVVPSGVSTTAAPADLPLHPGAQGKAPPRGRRGRDAPETYKTHAFQRESEAHGEVEEMILDMVMGMMLQKPGAAPSVHEALASRGFAPAVGNDTTAASAARPTGWDKAARKKKHRGFIDPASFRNATLSSEQVKAWETPHHVTQPLGGAGAAPREPQRSGVKIRPFGGGWGGTHGPGGGHMFDEANALRDMCGQNLEKFVVRRAMNDAAHTSPATARGLLVELLGVLLQVLQTQGGKTHPVATYLLSYHGEACHHALVRTLLHSLPFETLPYAPGALKFRLEFWVQRPHLVEVALAVQGALQKLEGVVVAPAAGESASAAPAADGTFAAVAKDLQSMLQDSRAGEAGAHDRSIVLLQDTAPTFQLTILAHHDDAGHPVAAAAEDRPAPQPGPLDDLPLLNEQVLTHLTTEIKLQGYAKTGVHLNPSMVDAFLSHTLQEVLLDDVVKKTIVSQTLKKMGVKGGRKAAVPKERPQGAP